MKATIPGEISIGNRLLLLTTTAGRLRQDNTEAVKELVRAGYHVIVITNNQPYEVLKKTYERNGIDPGKVFFIDTITAYAVGKTPPGVIDARFINSPTNLTDLGIALSSTFTDLSDQKLCVLFDSVSTMLIYLPSANISKFIHFLSNRLRLLDIPGIFLAVETGLDPMMLSQLTTLMDEVIPGERLLPGE